MAGRRFHTRTLPVWSNGQRVGLRFAAWLMQLPQEDFCQALGVVPHWKYEADGGPGVRCSPAPIDALHRMTARLAIHRCQCLHWQLRVVLHLGLTRR